MSFSHQFRAFMTACKPRRDTKPLVEGVPEAGTQADARSVPVLSDLPELLDDMATSNGLAMFCLGVGMLLIATGQTVAIIGAMVFFALSFLMLLDSSWFKRQIVHRNEILEAQLDIAQTQLSARLIAMEAPLGGAFQADETEAGLNPCISSASDRSEKAAIELLKSVGLKMRSYRGGVVVYPEQFSGDK